MFGTRNHHRRSVDPGMSAAEPPSVAFVKGRIERLEDLMRLWKGIAVILGGVTIAALGITWHVALQGRIEYIMAVVDQDYHELWRGKPGSYAITDLYVEHRVKQWIHLARARGDDATVLMLNRKEAVAMTTDRATKELDAYFVAIDAMREDERRRGNYTRTMPERFTIHRRSSTSYEFQWDERWVPQRGRDELRRVRAIIDVEIRPSRSLQGLEVLTGADQRRAPLGVYVTWFSWDEEILREGQR